MHKGESPSSKISRRASIWKVVSDCLFIFFKFLYFGLWNCSSRSGTVYSFLTALVKIGLYGPMIKKLIKNCLTSDRHQIWPTGSRQLKPIAGLVSVPNRWYASRNDVLKTNKNGGRLGKEFVAALNVKKYFWRWISTKYVLHNEFKSFWIINASIWFACGPACARGTEVVFDPLEYSLI